MVTRNFEEIRCERLGSAGIVTLNVPARRNALSLIMRRELTDAFGDLDANPEIKAIVLTGVDGNFCAGGDLKSMEGMDVKAGRARLAEAHLLVRQVAGMATPVIAAVDGYAYGAGLSLAAMCDIVVSAPDAKWSCAFGKVGLMPDLGTTWILPQRVGTGRARLLAYTARPIDGRQAVAWGLADQEAGDDGSLATALEIAAEIGDCAPLATARSSIRVATI